MSAFVLVWLGGKGGGGAYSRLAVGGEGFFPVGAALFLLTEYVLLVPLDFNVAVFVVFLMEDAGQLYFYFFS